MHNSQMQVRQIDAVSAISEIDLNLHGMEAVVGAVVNNTAVYTALARRYEDSRPRLAEVLTQFVAAHGDLLRGIEIEALNDELIRSFEQAPAPVMGEDGYFRAPLPPMLELTDADLAYGRVSALSLLGRRPSRVGRVQANYPDGTVGFFQGAREMCEGMLAAREGAWHN